MALNKYMHPRNRYKTEKPNFLNLALKYPDFRAIVTQDESGKVFLDFKNAEAVRTLTTCLLKEDFDLDVFLPPDRLVPTVPLRLNYIHWLEDILGSDHGKWGIDIGTGASCIYPLLGCKMNKWSFLASEADPENAFHAKKNVEKNDLGTSIFVVPVSTDDILIGPLEKFDKSEKFDFCMCNPPFFADHLEAQAITTTRKEERPEASTVSTASPQECISQGGEVGFIRRMIEESTLLTDKIRVYTSMVGKKTSLAKLKEDLRHHKVPKFTTTEFCQGKTMRWGVAWTFDTSVVFPKSEFKSRKEKPPLTWSILKGAGSIPYEVHKIADFIKALMDEIKVHHYQGKQAKSYTSITLTAAQNTWTHQRRLRRQQKRQTEGKEILLNNTLTDTIPYTQIEKSEVLLNNALKDTSTNSKIGKEVLLNNDRTSNSEPQPGLENSSTNSETSQTTKKITSNPQTQPDLGTNSSTNSEVSQTQVNIVTENNSIKTISSKIGTEVTNDSIENRSTAIEVDSSKHLIDKEVVNSNVKTKRKNKKRSFEKELEISSKKKQKKESISEATYENELKVVNNSHKELENNQIFDLNENKTKENQIDDNSVMNSSELPTSNKNNKSIRKDEKEISPRDFVLKCVLRLKRADEKIVAELEWLDGTNRELLYQLYTFIQNRMKCDSQSSSYM